MFKKYLISALIVSFAVFFSSAYTQDFSINDYVFIWNVAKEGRAEVKVQKDPNGVSILLGYGGGLGTIAIPPAEANAIGEILLKTEEYYGQFEKYFEERQHKITGKDFTKVEKIKDYEVWFYSEAKRKNFQVKISQAKAFKSMANLTKDEAVKIREHLMKSKKLAAYEINEG
jgi:hypothetical protein